MKEELDKARAIAPKGILGFNIMVATKRYEDYVKAALKAGSRHYRIGGWPSGGSAEIRKRF